MVSKQFSCMRQFSGRLCQNCVSVMTAGQLWEILSNKTWEKWSCSSREKNLGLSTVFFRCVIIQKSRVVLAPSVPPILAVLLDLQSLLSQFSPGECLQGGVNKACMTIHIRFAEDSSFASRLGVQKPLNGKYLLLPPVFYLLHSLLSWICEDNFLLGVSANVVSRNSGALQNSLFNVLDIVVLKLGLLGFYCLVWFWFVFFYLGVWKR